MKFLEHLFRRNRTSKPVILFYNDFFGRPPDIEALAHLDSHVFTTDRRAFSRAVAVVFHIPAMRKIPRIRKRHGQLWVAWSMESAANYPLLCDLTFMRNFDLTMTYHRSADIWCPYLPDRAALDKMLAAAVPEKVAPAPVAMFQSALANQSGRNSYALELMRYIKVHSYGRFANNCQLIQPDTGAEAKRATISRYKFCVGFENSISEDYVTEKFFDPLIAGTVPVYLGAPNVDEFTPGDHAFINASDFEPRTLAEYLVHLDHDENEYSSYYRWRKNGLSGKFARLLSRASKEPFARLCEIVSESPGVVRKPSAWPRKGRRSS